MAQTKHERLVTLTVWLVLVSGGAPALAQGDSTEEPQATSDQSQAERLAAERREKAQNLTQARVSSGEARMRGIEKSRFPFSIFQQGFHGFRPVMGGMPSGSGFVVGGGYVHGLESEVFTVSADAGYSTRDPARPQIFLTNQSFNPGYSGIIRDDPGMRLARGQQLILRCGGTDAARQDTPPEPVKECEAGHSRDPSNIRLLFAWRRARRVRARLPPPPPSPADARTSGSLEGCPRFPRWIQAISAVTGAAPGR